MQITKTPQHPLKWISLLLTYIILTWGMLVSPFLAQAQENGAPVIQQSDETGLILTWTPSAYSLSTQTIEGKSYTQIEIPQTALTGRPGHPQLPVYSGLIGLPPSGEAEVRILEIRRETARLPHLPLPAPVPQPVSFSPTELAPQTAVSGGPTVHTPDPAIYNSDAFYPSQIAALGDPQHLRGQRVAALKIHPVRVNPVTREMEIVRFIRLQITFTQPASTTLSAQRAKADPLRRSLGATLLNPKAAHWPPAAPPTQSLLTQQATVEPSTKVVVKSAGLYALTYADLQNVGLPVDSLDPRSLKLSHGYPRREVAILVEGEADGRFDAGDRLLFYAKPNDSRYVDEDVYFLSYGGPNGLRMSRQSGTPAGLPDGTAWRTKTTEANNFYDPLYEGRDGDYWYWDKLSQPDKTSTEYTIGLESPLTGSQTATLQVWFQGYTSHYSLNPDHRVRIRVNGFHVGTVAWDGKTAYTATLSVPANYLKAGQNQIRLTLPGIAGVPVEGTWLDAIELTYPVSQVTTGQVQFEGEAGQKKYTLIGVGSDPLIFDITQPDAPRRVMDFGFNGSTLTLGDADTSAASYLVVPGNQIKIPFSMEPANIFDDPIDGADYIIITHPSLAQAITLLATHRANQGLRVVTVDVNAIYDTYGPGRMEPEAIKTFLSHAYHQWPEPKPLYVLLVGDGSYDFKNYSGYNAPTLMPPYLAQVDPWWGETAADNRLVTVVGNDILPDMLIGRLPVSTPAETETVVNKIIQYETNPPGGSWITNQIFVADNPDSAGFFDLSAEQAYQSLSSSFSGQRFYYDEESGSQPHIYTDPDQLQADLVKSFNKGASFITFYGHSSWEQWAVESFLHLDTLAQLNNQTRLPIVSEMTCFTGFFHHPKAATLDESLLRRPQGGAVAVFGGTGLGVGTGHNQLQHGFHRTIMQDGDAVLGAAMLAGKLEVFGLGYHLDLIDTFTLFGDPALRLSGVFRPDVRITQQLQVSDPQPGDPITITLTVQNTGAGTATDIVVANSLPGAILNPDWSASNPDVNATGAFVWTLPDLASTQSVTIQIMGLIDLNLPADFSIVSRATVATGVVELNSQNNSSTLVIGGRRSYLPSIIKGE